MENICIIVPSLTSGGAEREAGLLSIELSKYYNVYLFLMNAKVITYNYKGTIVDLDYQGRKTKYRRLKRFSGWVAHYDLIRSIKKKKEELNVTCSISFLGIPNMYNILSKTRDKVVVSVRNYISGQRDNQSGKYENIFARYLYNHADKVVALSYGEEEDLIKNFHIKPQKVTTIYNFFDSDHILKSMNADIPDEYQQVFDSHDVVIMVGRFTYQKNHLRLIDEFAKVVEKNRKAFLFIMGQGELENQIREKIDDLDLNAYIAIVPYQTNPYAFMSRAKVLVLNSRYEGFCQTLLESIGCGTAIVSTDCMVGPREVLADIKTYNNSLTKITVCNRGILVPTIEPKRDECISGKLAEGILMLLHDEELRNQLVRNGKLYLQNYSNEALTECWVQVINGQ